ncbi:MAG: chitin disaccharide deacetylase [Defluviitaleaceae bacterium]|nr:chitin disaccharide deacetylase [Defluviitaleaceae bacterium]
MRVILNADDYGYSKGVNLGIIESHINGVVKSTTMMANMSGFEHGIKLAKENETLKIGVHLTLTAGKTLGGVYKTISDENGMFLPLREIENLAKENKLDTVEIENEYTLQIEKILNTGIKPTHFDGHHHTQCLPNIIDVFLKIAKKYNVPVRVSDKSIADKHNLKAVALNTEFFGENVTDRGIIDILSSLKEDTEIMCHPAYIDEFLYKSSSYNINRAFELGILTNQKLKDFINEKNIVISSFEDI